MRGAPYISLPSHPAGPYPAQLPSAACPAPASAQLEPWLRKPRTLTGPRGRLPSPLLEPGDGAVPGRGSARTGLPRASPQRLSPRAPFVSVPPAPPPAAGWRCPSRGTRGAAAVFPGGTRSGQGASSAGELSAAHRVPERARWRAGAR